MLKNYFKTAFRNLIRERNSSFINIAGLTLGITCSLILFLIISFHYSFDTFHSNREHLYRVVTQSQGNNGTEYQPGIPAVLPDAFKIDFPEIEKIAFTSYRPGVVIVIPQKNGAQKKYQEDEGVVFTEPSFFEMFDWQFIEGEPASALDEPYEAILNEDLAQKYFGKNDALGEVFRYGTNEYKVSAVVKNAPSNTDFPFTMFLSYATIKKDETGWHSISSDDQCYFMLSDEQALKRIEAQLPAFAKKYRGDTNDKTQFVIQNLKELHFDDRFDTYSFNTVPASMLIAFGVIAAILIFTACINFINLATAEAIKRSKEVGIRKTLGSSRAQLIFQFLGETTMITMFSVLLSLALTQLSLTFLNPFLDMDLALDFTNPGIFGYILLVTVAVALFSGLYPALVVSGFQPVLALKNKMNNRNSSGYYLRSGLVVLQFFISQFFIIGTIVLIRQMDYFQQKDLGFSKDAILVIPMPELGEDMDKTALTRRSFRNETSNIPGVESASLCNNPPSSSNISKTYLRIPGDENQYVTQVKHVDQNYIDLYELKLIGGTNLPDLDSVTGFIVNEQMAKTAGFQNPTDMLGTEMTVWQKKYPVVGIVRDFHTSSLEDPIEATILMNNSNAFSTLALKLNGKRIPEVLETIKKRWEEVYPEHMFSYEFLDESIKEFYESERKMATLLTVFTMMAIFIGCLGLFGLATFMANQKTKEIGVRKVMGASVESIILMFSKEFAKLIGIGFLIAAPLGGFAMQQFLDMFAYKITIGPGIFITSLAITILVALITVGYRSFRAAIVNPVKSLKYE